MPQIFCAVQCFECKTFQVQQEKKKPEFKCVVCGTKQTMQRMYAKSSKAKDCREVVMKFNAVRGEILENEYQVEEELPDEQENQYYEIEYTKTEKWKEFAADEEEKDFTIAAPAVVPKKPKAASQKRALEHTSEGAQSKNTAKHARAMDSSDGAFLREPPLAVGPARNPAPPAFPNSVGLSQQYAEVPHDNSALYFSSNATLGMAPVVVTMLPVQQQTGKKWSSFVDNDDAW